MLKLPDIAFIGGMGSGKTTAALHLVEHHGYVRSSFAEPLKSAAAELWDNPQRAHLQQLGKAVRSIDPDTLVEPIRTLIDFHHDGGLPVVIDDLRYPNEYWALRELGFKIVKISSRDEDRITRLQLNGRLGAINELHDETEEALKRVAEDWGIGNYGDVETLYHGIDTMLAQLAGRQP